MKKVLFGVGGLAALVVAFLLGAILSYFLFGGVKRAESKPPPASAPPNPSQSGTATVILDEGFFGAVMTTIFHDINAPSFPLAIAQANGPASIAPPNASAFYQDSGCDGRIYLLEEGSGVRTAVQFKDGKVVAPLAFKGTYSFLGVCMPFTGWAEANIEMRFDEAKQTVYGQLNIDSVNLDDLLSGLGNLVTPMIQRTINERVNPLEILRAPQLAMAINVKSSDGTFRAKVHHVDTEVANGQLKMKITYDFTGQKGQSPDAKSF